MSQADDRCFEPDGVVPQGGSCDRPTGHPGFHHATYQDGSETLWPSVRASSEPLSVRMGTSETFGPLTLAWWAFSVIVGMTAGLAVKVMWM